MSTSSILRGSEEWEGEGALDAVVAEETAENAAWEVVGEVAIWEEVTEAPESDAAEASESAPAEDPPASGAAEGMSFSHVMNHVPAGS